MSPKEEKFTPAYSSGRVQAVMVGSFARPVARQGMAGLYGREKPLNSWPGKERAMGKGLGSCGPFKATPT